MQPCLPARTRGGSQTALPLSLGAVFLYLQMASYIDDISFMPHPKTKTTRGNFPFHGILLSGNNPSKNTIPLELPTAYNKEVSVPPVKENSPEIPPKIMPKSPPEATRISPRSREKLAKNKNSCLFTRKIPPSRPYIPGRLWHPPLGWI